MSTPHHDLEEWIKHPTRLEKKQSDDTFTSFAFQKLHTANPPPSVYDFLYLTTCERSVSASGGRPCINAIRLVQFTRYYGADRVEMLVYDKTKAYESMDDMPRALVLTVDEIHDVINGLFN